MLTAQVWNQPTETWAQFFPPGTFFGVASALVLPLPSWPRWLSPQQYSAPPVVMAQVLDPPADTEAHVDLVPTWTGATESMPLVPLPIWPKLSRPPHPRVPGALLPHENSPPLETWLMPATVLASLLWAVGWVLAWFGAVAEATCAEPGLLTTVAETTARTRTRNAARPRR